MDWSIFFICFSFLIGVFVGQYYEVIEEWFYTFRFLNR